MSMNAFIPKVWSARLIENLHRSLVFGALCNRNWEGEIRQCGDTVHIPSLASVTVKEYDREEEIDDPETLSGQDTALAVDQSAYFNFIVNDVDAAQARADIMEAAMRSAAQKMAEREESYLLSVIRAGAGHRVTWTVPAAAEGGLYKLIVRLRTELDQLNVPRQNRCLVMPPTAEGELLMDDRFVTATAAGALRLREGAVARAAGFDIYISNDLTDELVAMTPEAVTFAEQIVRTEAYRREKGFDEGVKGLAVYGAKVVLPACLYYVTLGA